MAKLLTAMAHTALQGPPYLTEFWKAVQSSWNSELGGMSSSLHFFRMDWRALVK